MGTTTRLRRRVEVLLRRHDQANSILERPAFESAAMLAPQSAGTEGPAPRQERRALSSARTSCCKQIGEGGMGTVWMAEQQEPVRRLVALKVIKAGMDTARSSPASRPSARPWP